MKKLFPPSKLKLTSAIWFFALIIFGFFLTIYWKTCCRTIFWWDSAEFVAAIATSGVPHPPSFPLYMLLGKIFSFAPFLSLPLKLNLLSGIFSALSLAICFLLFLKFSQICYPELIKDGRLLIFSASSLLLVAGLNYAFWIQGVRAEVYSLNGLIFVFLLLGGLNFLSSRGNPQKNLRWLYLFFFVFGLGMGNHHVTLLSTLPAFLFLFISYSYDDFLKLKNLGLFLFFFFLGCSVYLYLPFRAINSPSLNWGDPVNFKEVLTSALALKSAKQIGLALNFSLGERTKEVWEMVYSQFTFFPFLTSLIGFCFLIKKNLKLFIFFLILIIGNLSTIIILPSEFISTSLDFQGYILPVIFSFALLFGLGVLFILQNINEWISGKKLSPDFRKILVIIFSIFFFSISFLPFLTSYRIVDLSKNGLAYRYGKGVLSQTEENAVVLIDNPNLYFILCALKYGEDFRKDVAVLDRGLLQAKWNCEQERENYPLLFFGVPPDLRGEDLFLALMKKGSSQNLPLYMEFTEIDSELVNLLSPAGYLFKVNKKIWTKLPEELIHKQRGFEDSLFFKEKKEVFQYDLDAQRMYVFITYRWGLYYEQKKMFHQALNVFSLALELDPLNLELQERIERLKDRIDSQSRSLRLTKN